MAPNRRKKIVRKPKNDDNIEEINEVEKSGRRKRQIGVQKAKKMKKKIRRKGRKTPPIVDPKKTPSRTYLWTNRRSLDLTCQWADCHIADGSTFADGLALSEHIERQHIGNAQNLTCKWADCPTTTPASNVGQLRRHATQHAYHANLLKMADITVDRLQLPACQLPPDSRLPPPFPPEDYMCQWRGCEQMLEGFASICAFQDHVRRHVVGSTAKTAVHCGWAMCSVTAADTFRLQQHIKVHTKERAVACGRCGSHFASKAKLADHRRRQSPLEMQVYQCAQCSKLFASERLLRDHMRNHVNTYKCSMCDMTCSKPMALVRHIQYRHLDYRYYQCELCDYGAITKSDLATHLATHYTGRRLHCDHCPFTCRAKVTLDSHCDREHPEEMEGGRRGNVYECHCCRRTFNRGGVLTRHLMQVHNFRWPSGHARFRYKLDPLDGIRRLETVRFESIEVTQTMMAEIEEGKEGENDEKVGKRNYGKIGEKGVKKGGNWRKNEIFEETERENGKTDEEIEGKFGEIDEIDENEENEERIDENDEEIENEFDELPKNKVNILKERRKIDEIDERIDEISTIRVENIQKRRKIDEIYEKIGRNEEIIDKNDKMNDTLAKNKEKRKNFVRKQRQIAEIEEIIDKSPKNKKKLDEINAEMQENTTKIGRKSRRFDENDKRLDKLPKNKCKKLEKRRKFDEIDENIDEISKNVEKIDDTKAKIFKNNKKIGNRQRKIDQNEKIIDKSLKITIENNDKMQEITDEITEIKAKTRVGKNRGKMVGIIEKLNKKKVESEEKLNQNNDGKLVVKKLFKTDATKIVKKPVKKAAIKKNQLKIMMKTCKNSDDLISSDENSQIDDNSSINPSINPSIVNNSSINQNHYYQLQQNAENPHQFNVILMPMIDKLLTTSGNQVLMTIQDIDAEGNIVQTQSVQRDEVVYKNND